MDDLPVSESQRPRLGRDGPWLIALLVLVGLLRVWLISNTEVPARDGIGFIRYSLRFDEQTWSEAIRSQHQHPGYAVVIWLVAKPIRALWGTTPETMQFAAQFVSLAASLVLAVVMFYLGKHLWNRFVGFFGALLFQFFPTSGHHLSDGLSDPLFLCLVASALLNFAWALGARRDEFRALRTDRSIWFFVGGLFVGLAYLTRPEGLLLLPAVVLTLLGMQLTSAQRQSWSGFGRDLAGVLLACVLAGSPYVLATGTITQKVSARQVLEQTAIEPAPGASSLFASVVAATFTPGADLQEQAWRSLRAMFMEFTQALNYIGAVFFAAAFVMGPRSVFRRPGNMLLAVYFLIHAAVLVRLGIKVHYVSDRHVMPLVMMSSFVCVLGVMEFCRRVMLRMVPGLRPKAMAAVALAVTLGVCLGKTTQRVHVNREGNLEAGRWLARHVRPCDVIDDDHGWSHFYSGALFTEGQERPIRPEEEPRRYYVMTRSRDSETRDRRDDIEEDLRAASGQIVYHWPAGPMENARVVVYQAPRSFATHPWTKAPAVRIPILPVSRSRD